MSIQAIFQAIKENDLPTLTLLLQVNPQALHESNNDYFQFTPLLYAAVFADFGIFEWLINSSPKEEAKSALNEILNHYLTKLNAKINSEDVFPLYTSCYFNMIKSNNLRDGFVKKQQLWFMF